MHSSTNTVTAGIKGRCFCDCFKIIHHNALGEMSPSGGRGVYFKGNGKVSVWKKNTGINEALKFVFFLNPV